MSAVTAASAWIRNVVRLVVFDVERHRGVVLVLLALELGRAGIAETRVRLGFLGVPIAGDIEPLWLGGIGLYDTILWFASLVAMATFVQADHPADDRAFWRTRPIAPGTRAAGTVAAVALLCVVVPAVVNALRQAAYGAPLGSIGAATLQLAVLAGFTLLPAWPLAIGTRTLPRFFAGVVLVLVSSFFLAMRLGYPGYTDHPIHGGFRYRMPLPVFDWRRHDLLGWWTSAGFVAAGAGLGIAHYATRRTLVTLPAAAALVGTTITWPAGFDPSPARPELAKVFDGGLRVDAVDGLPTGQPLVDFGGRIVPVYGDIVLPPLPAGVSARVALGLVAVDTPTRVVHAEGGVQCCRGHGPLTLFPPGPEAEHFRNGFPYVGNTHLFTADGTDAAALTVPRIGIRAAATVDLTRHRAVAWLPLEAGASYLTDRYRVDIASRRLDGYGNLAIRLARFPTLGRADEPRIWFLWADATGRVVGYAHSELWTTDGEWRDGFERPGWANGRSWVDRFVFQVGFTADPRPARLVVIESYDAGRVETTLVARDVIARPPRRPS